MSLKHLTFVIIWVSFFSCEKNKEVREKEEANKYFALVYVDLSRSSSEQSISEVQEKIIDLYKSLPARSFVDIRALNFPGGTVQVYKAEKEYSVPFEAIPSKERELEKITEAKLIEFSDSIINKSLLIFSKDNGKANSCILNTFDPAHDILLSKSKSYKELHLYYFSDMVEDCSNSISSSKINIFDTKSIQATNNIINNWKNIPNYTDINCYIHIVYTNNTNIITSLDYGELKKFWEETLLKMKFDDSKITYGIEL